MIWLLSIKLIIWESMKKLSEIISFKTSEARYKNTIINFIVSMSFILILLIIDYFIPIELLSKIFAVLLFIFSFHLFLSFISRMICISDNKDRRHLANATYQFKYKPIEVSFEDFKFWIHNAKEPETLYVKSLKGNYHIIEVSFDILGRRGSYYNRKWFLDEIQFQNENDFLKKVMELGIVIDQHIKVYETFDKNNPEVIIKTIDELKKIYNDTIH